jgi:hypothetical protein
MHWVSDPEERKLITSKMRGKPWQGVFDSGAASEIMKKYGVRPDFDLAGSLSEAFWRYGKTREKPPTALSVSEKDRGTIDCIHSAVLLGIWKANNQKEYEKRTEKGRFSAADRWFRMQTKRPGRLLDLGAISLIRTLGAIFQDGTGRKPFVTRSPGKGFRGGPYRFAVEVCAFMGVRLSESHLREMEYRSKMVNCRHKNQQATIQNPTSIDNIMIKWVNK